MNMFIDLGSATTATKGPQFTDLFYDGNKVFDGAFFAKTGSGTVRKVF